MDTDHTLPIPRPGLRPTSVLAASIAAATVAGLAAVALAAPPVKLTPAQEQAIGLRTAPLEATKTTAVATLPAVFVRPPSGRAAVSAPFAGTVISVAVVEGQAVRAGEALATVFSRDALSESAALGQARAEAALAATTAARTRRLVDEGIVAGARAGEADARAEAARAMLGAKSLSVRAAGVGASGRYVLRAPFAGRVADVQVTAGQGIPDMATAFVIDREGRIQIEAVLPAALAGRVRPGARAVVEGVEGRVVAVGAEIDPKTRSLSVRAEIPPRPDFIPGRAARVALYDDVGEGLSGPRGAVTTMDGKTVVFVRTPNGFTAVPVRVVGYSGEKAVLAGPLKAGAAVAFAGVSELKAQAQGR